MELIHSDFKKGIVKIRITDPEDLWYLSHLIDEGDVLTGTATRKIKIGSGENDTVAKKTFTITIAVETIDLAEKGDVLRVNGKTQEELELVPKGSYQALSLEVGEEFILEKSSWLSYQKQKLQEATQKKYHYLLCLADREEALFALTKKSGYEILLKVKGDVPKKGNLTESKKDFFQEIGQSLQDYALRYHPEQVILASPAFYKEEILKKVSSLEVKKKITLAICSDVSETSLDEVMKRPELKNVLQLSRARQEKLLIDELLAEISKNNLACYGWKETQKAVNSGALNRLLITEHFIQKKRKESTYSELDSLMKQVDALKGEIFIISSEHEGGRRLDGLGGIAGLLRFKIWE